MTSCKDCKAAKQVAWSGSRHQPSSKGINALKKRKVCSPSTCKMIHSVMNVDFAAALPKESVVHCFTLLGMMQAHSMHGTPDVCCKQNKLLPVQAGPWHAFAERPGTVLIIMSLYCCCCEIASVCVCLILKAIETTCTDLKGGLDGSQPNQPSLLFVTLSLCLPQQLLHNLLVCCMACACDMICTCLIGAKSLPSSTSWQPPAQHKKQLRHHQQV